MTGARHLLGCLALALAPMLAIAALAQEPPTLRWDPGAEDCSPADAKVEARAIDDTTIVIRQNPCVDYEAPFLYLLIGEQRALLIDSGASDDPRVTGELTALVTRYLETPDGGRRPLVVAHTHGHQDHRAGDAAFAALTDTTVAPYEGEAMRKFFGLDRWPDAGAHFELGNRRIEIVPTPGHHPDHVVFVDPRTRLLFSGDFVLPGRLLVEDIDAYAAGALGVIEAVTTYGTQYALGGHVEMDSRGELYANGATLHADEHSVFMPFDTNAAVRLRQDLLDFNGFYERGPGYVIVNPMHNLLVLAAGVILVLVLIVWSVRRWLRRRRGQTS